MLDLKGASRDDLIRLVLWQRERIADLEPQAVVLRAEIATLQTTVAHLTQQLGAVLTAGPAPSPPAPSATPPAARSRPMPGTKPTERPVRPTKPRKHRAQGFGRRRMAPTTRQVHAVDQCPDCGVRLAGGSVKRTREVIEVPVVPVTVTEHVYLERQCPCCRKR